MNIQNKIESTKKLINENEFELAQKMCTELLSKYPDNLDIIYLSGLIEYNKKNYYDAIKIWNKGLSIQVIPSFYYNIAVAYSELNDSDKAIHYFRNAIAVKPDYAEAYNNLAIELHEKNITDEAIEKYKKAISFKDNYYTAIYNLGNAYKDIKQYELAKSYYQKAIEIKPEFPKALNNLGDCLFHEKKYNEALNYYTKALSINPEYYEAYYNIGNTYFILNKVDTAINFYNKSLSINPNYVNALSNKGNAFYRKGLYDKAIELYKKALLIDPNHVDTHYNFSFSYLLKGDLLNGFKEYEWRLEKEDFTGKDFDKPKWDGKEFKGKTLFLYTKQGYGDIIHLIRYIPMLKKLGGNVYIGCEPVIIPLLKTVNGIDNIIATGQKLPDFDIQASIMSLPYYFKTTLQTIPAKTPYIFAPEKEKQEIVDKINKNTFNIGIVWAGNPIHKDDHNRSIKLSKLEFLFNIPQISIYSLQKGIQEKEITENNHFKITDLSKYINDFSDTATIIKHLDLIITVDTATAHLAGAMNAPVWVLLPFIPDWRWMLNRDDSPWYPSMRLFRQKKIGKWDHVFNLLKLELNKIMDKRNIDEKNISESNNIINNDKISIKENDIEKQDININDAIKDIVKKFDSKLYDESAALCEIFLKKYPDNFDLNYLRGSLAIKMKKYDLAINLLEKSIKINPDIAEAYNNLGEALKLRKRFDQAIEQYKLAIKKDPSKPDFLINLGLTLQFLEKYEEAMHYYNKVLTINPSKFEAFYYIGLCFQNLYMYENAIKFYKQAIRLKSDSDKIYNDLGVALYKSGNYEDALKSFNKAISINKDNFYAHENAGIVLLLAEELIEGFLEYQWFRQKDNVITRNFKTPYWDGSNFKNKTLLIYTELGYGDSIHFIRYAKIAKKFGGNVIVECQPQLKRLFQTIKDIDYVFDRNEKPPHFDIQTPLMILPCIFRTNMNTIPQGIPYIHPPVDTNQSIAQIMQKYSNNICIGIVWGGDPANENDKHRSIELKLLTPLLAISQVKFFSLQKGPKEKELSDNYNVINLSPFINDFADTMSATKYMNIIITVETSVSHLAGASGANTWVMLPYVPDWRWLLKRSDSPWYPTVKLFRQKKADQWTSVVEEVKKELCNYIFDYFYMAGQKLLNSGKEDKASFCFKQILSLSDNSKYVHYFQIGNIYSTKGWYEKSIYYYNNAVSIKPDFFEAWFNLGTIYYKMDVYEQAVNCYNKVIKIDPNNTKALYNLAASYYRTNKYNEAVNKYKKLLTIDPDYIEAYSNMGAALGRLGKIDEAKECYKYILSKQPENPDAHFNYSLILLINGEIKKGFKEYEWRFKRKAFINRKFGKPVWKLEDLSNKTLLIFAEQGFGDSILFVRYANIVKNLYKQAKVFILCRKNLASLFSSIKAVDLVIEEGKEVPDFDYEISMMSLPYLFETDLNQVPDTIPYLFDLKELNKEVYDIIKKQEKNFKIGLVWAGNPNNEQERNRSIPLEFFEQISKLPSISLFSLQKGLGVNNIYEQINIISLDKYLDDFASTASIICKMDLIISIDTAVAHLAGALGKETWVLLSKIPAWCWLMNGETSPWYPGVKLFRQTKDGSWLDIIHTIMDKLIEISLKYSLDSKEVYHNIAVSLKYSGQYEKSIEWYKKALQKDPDYIDAHHNLGLSYLTLGDFKNGWKEHEWRQKRDDFTGALFSKPLWDGSHCNKKLFLYTEQGFGDSIQFVRYIPIIRPLVSEIIVACPQELKDLFSTINEIDKLIINNEKIPEFDFHAPILSLPAILQIDFDTINSNIPYLFPKPNPSIELFDKIHSNSNKIKIGIAWSGSCDFPYNHLRSIHILFFEHITKFQNLCVYSLQKGPKANDLKEFNHLAIQDLSSMLKDFSDTAFAISQMDLIITVDTSIAHLAGSMGKPVWLMLSYAADWRWLLNRDDNPWYPSMRLFRQKFPGDWVSVMKKVIDEFVILTKQDLSLITLNLAIAYYKKHRYIDAVRQFLRSIFLNFGNLRSYYLMGNSLLNIRSGYENEAVSCYQMAIMLKPDFTDAYFNIGTIASWKGNYKEAFYYYEKVATLEPDDPRGYLNMGMVSEKQGDFNQAIESYEKAVKINPNQYEALNNLSFLYFNNKNFKLAVKCFEKLLDNNNNPEIFFYTGMCYQYLNNAQKAEYYYQKVLSDKIDNPDVFFNIANCLIKLEKMDDALDLLKKATQAKSDFYEAINKLGQLYDSKGDITNAIICFRKAIEIKNDYIDAHFNLGNALCKHKQYSEAIELYKRTISIDNNHIHAHCNLSLTLLLLGDLKQGFIEYEWRLKKDGYSTRNYSIPKWEGQELEKKMIAIWGEQGIGDDIMFASIISDVINKGAKCVIECDNRLIPIYKRSFKGAVIIPNLDQNFYKNELKNIDYHIPVGSLGKYFRTSFNDFPNKSNYLKADPEKIDIIKRRYEKLGTGLKIGISWKSSSAEFGKQRTVDLKHWEPILKCPELIFINLQYGDCSQEIEEISKTFNINIFNDESIDSLKNLDDFAAQIMALDLVITIDNATAHIAGALGINVWTMIPYYPDWPWLINNERTPWYPQMKLFRQSQNNNWNSVVAEIAVEAGNILNKKVKKYDFNKNMLNKKCNLYDSPIIIMGLPRSGTSLIAGIFQICGAWLGETVSGGKENPLGYFENTLIREHVNKKILTVHGCDPLGVRKLPAPDSLNIIPNLKETIHYLIHKQGYQSNKKWLYKEPNITLVWEIYRFAFENAKWIIVRRNKDDIVNSCLNTSFMVQHSTKPEFWYRWIELFEQRLDQFKQESNTWYREIWPHELILDDLNSLKRIIIELGLNYDEKEIKEFIRPKFWHAPLNND